MSVRVRMAPSPTGRLHVGNVRTFLFNWLFARHEGGEFRLRIENTDTGREVEGAVELIQDSMRWLGLDWDGDVTFTLDRLERHQSLAQRLVDEGRAYEDEGAVRMRMPDEGATVWEDAVLGRIEYPNEKLEDVVILRSDRRPTYNFATPIDDADDEITHVVRADDHVPNTPKQIRILEALGLPEPVFAHVPQVLGEDGKRLSKRHGSVSVQDFRDQGYLPEALVNFLALLGWAPDGETTIMSRDELVERFTLDRVRPSASIFDYAKLDWMNGHYLRELPTAEFADRLVAYLVERGYGWDEETLRQAAALVQEKIKTLGEFPSFAGFFFEEVEPDPELLDPDVLAAAEQALAPVEPFTAAGIEAALRAMAERLGLGARKAFQPVRVAVTGSRVSPGLFESLELLGKERSLERLRTAAAVRS